MDDLFFTLLRYSLVGIGVSIGGLIYSFVKKSSETPNLRLDLATRLAFFFTLILSSSFFIFSIVGMDSPQNTPPLPPPTIQEDRSMRKIDSRRDAFKAWLSNLDANLEIFDARWQNLWTDSFDSFQAGSVTMSTLYHNTEILQIEMERLRERINHSHPPEQLTRQQQKKLRTALDEFDEMIKLRLEACEDFQELVKKNKLSQKKLDKIREKLYRSNECIQRANADVSDVRLELGL